VEAPPRFHGGNRNGCEATAGLSIPPLLALLQLVSFLLEITSTPFLVSETFRCD
jgi:hypothetical protein